AAGQYDLDTPEQLLKLLASMVRNKVAKVARHEQAERRDRRRVDAASPDAVVGPDPTPSRQGSARELLEHLRRVLGDEERRLLELRQQGLAGGAIAEQVGGTAEARRKQRAGAAERVAAEVGLEDDGE